MPPRMDIYRRGRQLERLSNTGHALLNSLLHDDDLHYFAVCQQRFLDPQEEQYPADWLNKDRKKLKRMLEYWRSKMREVYYFTVVNGRRQLKACSSLRRSARRKRRCGYTYTESSDLPSPQEEEINGFLRAETEAMGNHEYYAEGEEREIDYA
ncbi:uncharacterized protein FSUBG_13700 [Fusarium subglutinans]|uniref:Uncharacterized protein n=1 Tax=Gibberella subglutinans TaxID=42677 RepID=A0A8H5KQZ6_GIBSU|nr:uncharacterized protein FSUBG_13700 [Fusarium subglutinans]KAF5578910.1 hypothetical protein FSUBG_13700 [Fusarium subglutinans]